MTDQKKSVETPEKSAQSKAQAVNSLQLSAQRVTVYALLMSVGTLSSRVLGLVRDTLFFAYFDRTVTDAWTVAFRIPNMFRRLLGEGSLSVSFIPVFVSLKTEKGEQNQEVKNLINGFYTLLLLILSVLTVLGIIFGAEIVGFIVDQNFSQVPGKFELTVRLAQIMFIFIFFMSTYAYFMGILNACGKYALAAAAPALFNVSMILSMFVPEGWFPVKGDPLAWGVVFGGFLQTIVLVPTLRRLGYFPSLSLKMFSDPIKMVWRNMLPGFFGLGLLQITTLINTRFASSLGEGTNSYIYLADRLLELPLSLVSVSLGTALLPILSNQWALGKVKEMHETTEHYLGLNLFLSLLAATGLYFMPIPILEVLFGYGKFSALDAQLTAEVLKIYSLIIISSSAVRVFVPSFYAIKNTWYPAVVSAACLIFHVIMAPILISRYQLQGLIYSTFFSGVLNFVLLFTGYKYFIGEISFFKFVFKLLKFLVLAVPSILIFSSYDWVQAQMLGSGTSMLHLKKAILVILYLGIGSLVYFTISYVLQVPECKKTLDQLGSKVKTRLMRL